MDDFNTIRHRGVLRSFVEALSTFRDLSATMPVGEVIMFLQVALNEGEMQAELAKKAGLKISTASRYLLDLSDKTRAGGEGYGLVRSEADPGELRRKVYSLTPKGRVILRKLVEGHTEVKRHDDLP